MPHNLSTAITCSHYPRQPPIKLFNRSFEWRSSSMSAKCQPNVR